MKYVDLQKYLATFALIWSRKPTVNACVAYVFNRLSADDF
jgi:hypothetical protein